MGNTLLQMFFFFKTWQEWKQNISFNCNFCNNLHSQHSFIRVSTDILPFWSEEQVIKRLLLFTVNNFLYQTFLVNFWIPDLFNRLISFCTFVFLIDIAVFPMLWIKCLLLQNHERYAIKCYCFIGPVYLMLLFEYIYEQ